MLQPKRIPSDFPKDNEMYISHLSGNIRKPLFKQRFLVQSGEQLIPVPSADIAYFYAEDRWTYLITKGNKRYLVDHKLKDLEKMMHPDHFFRINRSYMMSRESILCLNPYLKGQLKVRVEPHVSEQIVVSRAKTPVFKQWLSS
ncbi:MAG: LytTR family transcriptional regulator [Roseivirga sp.]|nr:LytTR family transcriptional regulator [Roseivirga sp.]